MNRRGAVRWRPLGRDDLGEITELARKCLAHDGGLPATASAGFLERRYTGVVLGAYDGERLVASGAAAAAVVGTVDPEYRGQGIGAELLDRLLNAAQEPVRVATEALTPQAHRLFTSRGLRQTFAEDVFRRELATPVLPGELPGGTRVEEWAAHNTAAFHEAYHASFADRPGFPGWTHDEWVEWLVDDEFLPGCSLLARTPEGTPVGFVACARGFLIQVGAVPAWRRRGLARGLAALALERLRTGGGTEVFLDVNVNNPASAGLFTRLGFEAVARRARYEHPSPRSGPTSDSPAELPGA
ncbi:GNAT family N-acetyltransferase [Kitasatospora sp. NPDC127111]|uniref:GNAT family N-acetyltransferase n=1 Tax=Kitasatospora sp. NPDC127111 TaxID=3345363 RepID=UPI003630EC06